MSNQIVCTSCGYVGQPKSVTRGSFGVELVLWACLIVPGLVYSAWRLSSRHDACPMCGKAHLIPLDSPMGRKFASENLPDLPAPPVHAPSKAARSAGRSLGRLVGRVFGSKRA